MQFIEATRFFIARNDLTLNIREFHGTNTQDIFQDENVRVVPLVIYNHGHAAPAPKQPEESREVRGRVACHIQPNEGREHDFIVHLRTQYNPAKHAMAVEAHPADPPSATNAAAVAPQTHSHGPKPARRMKEFHKTLPWISHVDSAVCYAVHTPDIPGKFDAKMADKLGVKPNMRSRLVKGEPVTVEDGRVVQPSECISPATPGSIIIIVHCPSQSFVSSLIEDHKLAWEHYQSNPATKMIVHMTPRDVLIGGAYSNWMASFGSEVQHMVFNEDHCASEIVFQSSAVNLNKLSVLDDAVFRKPFTSEIPRVRIAQDFAGSPIKVLAGRPLDTFHLAPLNALGLDRSDSLKPLQPLIDSALAKLMDPSANSEFVAEYDKLKQAPSSSVAALSSGFEVVCLGTGAALPSKYRNVSSTYLHIDGRGGLLFDAGEGSYGQLFRRYGAAEIDEIIRGIRCIFVSHMHADHHLGVLRILAHRAAVRRKLLPSLKVRHLTIFFFKKNFESQMSRASPVEPVVIIGPTAYSFWLKEYCTQCEPLADTYVYYDNFDFWQGNQDLTAECRQKLLHTLGISEVLICPVVHCPDAFAVAVKHTAGWKVVFSGDTRPCAQLDSIGKDCTILIHEATFEDNLSTEAVEKRHSTTTEAIQSALNMNARFLLMNHFSQRYPKIPVFDSRYNDRTGVAFDLMSVRPEYFHRLPSFLPCLTRTFAETRTCLLAQY
jgi:ribonuclease Z